ncbi:MAG: DNA-formamidopyrimidine glycosylase family protein [Planctomycetota bacterium]
MPEFPDLEVYRYAIEEHLGSERLEFVEPRSPFFLRTHEPPLSDLFGSRLVATTRLGKQLCLHFEADGRDETIVAVLHLMIAGRLRFRSDGKEPNVGPKSVLARFAFGPGDLWVTEASPKRRAALRLCRGGSQLAELDRGGLEVFESSNEELAARLRSENRTLKRALTDPRLLAAIGNAYSDELLWAAQLSPTTRTQSLTEESMARLLAAIRTTLAEWRDKLHAERRGAFPDKVTAFHPDMAVHGRFEQPCRRCGSAIQRIRYASNEANYCPPCQTDGVLLRDRSLSQLLKGDWPKTFEELEERKAR